MNIKRESVARRKQIRFAAILFSLTAAVAFAGWRLSLLKPASSSVERATGIDIVKRGPMVRDVFGMRILMIRAIQLVMRSFERYANAVAA
jgi:hypothetical protein